MARYCTKCGKEINENAEVCVHCGCVVDKGKSTTDTGSVGWTLLGFFVSTFFSPLVGLIIWLAMRDNSPKNAKKVAFGTLISLVPLILILLGFGIYMIVIVSIGASSVGAAATIAFDGVRMFVSSFLI